MRISRFISTVRLIKQPKTAKKTWETTRLNLLGHKSGRYYARVFENGKEIWKALCISHFSEAEAKLTEFLKEHRERRKNANDGSAKMTFGEAAAIHLQNLDDSLNQAETARLLERGSHRASEKLAAPE